MDPGSRPDAIPVNRNKMMSMEQKKAGNMIFFMA
jgi:hypothetical protein